jgi:hypothetical protein
VSITDTGLLTWGLGVRIQRRRLEYRNRKIACIYSVVSDMGGASISTLIRIAVADYLKNLPKRLAQGRTLHRAKP